MKKAKLVFEKFKIAELKNQAMIKGGNGDNGETLPTFQCINLSLKWVPKKKKKNNTGKSVNC